MDGRRDGMKREKGEGGYRSMLNGTFLLLYSGQGFDRHLFALKTLATAEGLSPPIFQDPSYSHICHIILSTSTLSSDAVLIGGFAPVTPDGYGVGYGVHDDWLGTQVATYPTCDGEEFVANIKNALDNIHNVLNGRNFKESK